MVANRREDVANRPLGPTIRRAWVGYQQQLDAAMAAAGFDDRRFPDGRVLRLCRDSPGITVAQIGRELGITRQGASKVVNRLREHGYVRVRASSTSGRENTLMITPRARDYLEAQRAAVRTIERRLRKQLGAEAVESARAVLESLAGADDTRMRDYLRAMKTREP